MKRKISNLEEYYLELQKDGFMSGIKFQDLPASELMILEVSEGFRRFLIKGAWTKGLTILICFVLLPLSIILSIYLKHIA